MSGRTPATEPSAETTPYTGATAGAADGAAGGAAGLPRIDERFGWGALLGKGGMGRVVSAADRRLRRDVALKILNPTERSDAAVRFLDEAQITAQLQHPNIIPIYDIIDSSDGQPIIAMKPIAGETFAAVIRRAHKKAGSAGISAELRRLLEIFSRVCDAVAFAHNRGIIHRDLKPHNIMVGEFGDVVVMDWGLAKPIGYTPPEAPPPARSTADEAPRHIGRDSGRAAADSSRAATGRESGRGAADSSRAATGRESGRHSGRAVAGRDFGRAGSGSGSSRAVVADSGRDSGRAAELGVSAGPLVTSDRRELGLALTMTGVVQGTPAYMAPEQALGGRSLDEGADIFALGGILYTLLTNHLPVDGDTVGDELSAIIEHQIIAPRQRAPHAKIPAELEAVALRAMARRRRDRFATVKDLQAEIERFWDGKLLESASYSPLQRIAKWVRRHPTLAMSATVSVVFVAVLGVVVSAWFAQAERAAAAELVAVAEAARAAEAEARHRDAETVALERQRLLDAMNAGNFSHVLELLSGQVHTHRDAAIEEFIGRYESSVKAGLSTEKFIGELGIERIADYVRAFDRVIEAHRKWGVTVTANDFFYRGVLRYLGLKDNPGALADFDRAIELDPNYSQAFFNRSVVKSALGDIAGVIRDCDRAIELDPEYASAYNNRGVAKKKVDDLVGALRDFDRAIELDPEYATTYNNRAATREVVGDLAGARRDYDRAIELDPEYAEAYVNRGLSKAESGDWVGALRDYDRAIEIRPDSETAHNNRATAKIRQGDLTGALRDCNRAIEIRPDYATAYSTRADVKAQLGDRLAAMSDYDKAIELRPEYARAFSNRGLTKAELGDWEGALRDYDRAIEIDPDFADAFFNRGNTKADRDPLEAIRDYDRAVELNPRFVQALTNRGATKSNIRDFAGALRDHDRAIELNSNFVLAYVNRGIAKFGLGDFAGALRDYDRAIELDPRFWQAWAHRAHIRFNHTSDRAAGIRDLQQAYRLCPDPAAKQQFGQVLRRLGAAVPE